MENNTTDIQIPLPKEMKNGNYSKHAILTATWLILILNQDLKLVKLFSSDASANVRDHANANLLIIWTG